MINIILSKKINKMASLDQKARKQAMRSNIWDHVKILDKKNTLELKKIIKIYGWPTIPMVGKKASFNAWLLAQHADKDLKFQKKVLELLKNIYKKNNKDINPSNIAFLTDRILVAEGKKQIFGTQFHLNKKKLFVSRPIKNIKDIEKRRKEYKMRPFLEDLLSAKERFKK
jgi:hypothetical protein